MSQKTFAIHDLILGKAFLPNLACISQFFLSPKRKTPLDELDSLLNAHALIQCNEQMNVIRHYYEIVDLEFFGGDIRSQHVHKRKAIRSDCKSALPWSVFDVTKNVRSSARIELESAFREGLATGRG
jgi:hypothetical protein